MFSSPWSKVRLLCGVVLAWLAPATGNAQPPSPAVENPSAAREFLLKGIAERAATLKSAVFSARGQKRGAGKDEKDDIEIANGDILVHGAIEGGRLRFDYEEPRLSLAPEKIAKPILNDNLTVEQAQLALKVAKSNLTNHTKEDLVPFYRKWPQDLVPVSELDYDPLLNL